MSQEQLTQALQGLLDKYTMLVNSGDAGNWDPEEEPEVIAARAAISATHPAQAQQVAGEVLTESYVQTVPDKCDRIVWRGYYYTLPPTPPAQAAADANGSA